MIFAWCLFWDIVGILRPIVYTGSDLDSLADYVKDVYRRGLNGARLEIRCEQNGRTIVYRKTLQGWHGIGFYVRVPVESPAEAHELNVAVEGLKLESCSISRGGEAEVLEVNCGGILDNADAVTSVVAKRITRKVGVATFSARVKGRVCVYDIHVDRTTSTCQMLGRVGSPKRGRVYRRG